MSTSRKHHFLPVFYLKGFADKKGVIHLYDKVRDMIIESQDPRTTFYENDLNNYKPDAQTRISLEESLFSPLDSRIAPLFAKFLKEYSYEFTALEKFEILKFLNQLYWRLPQSNALYVKLIQNEGLSNKYFALRNKNTKRYIPDEEIAEMKNQILANPELQKMLKHIVPLTDGAMGELYKLFDNWRVYTIHSPAVNFITGDHPFLINNPMPAMDNIFNEFIFPLGKSQLLVISDKSPVFFDAVFLANVNSAILAQSARFIASNSLEQLSSVVAHFKELQKQGLLKNRCKATFDFMHYQSGFDNHAAYHKDYVSNRKK